MQRVFAVWLCLALGVACRANIITVDDGSADYTTIQAAIDASNNGDIVVVCPGTYTGVGNYNINFAGKAITVRSTDPQDQAVVAATIINCEYLGRGFHFNSSEGPDSIVNGFTIVNADDSSLDDEGGAIRCDSSSPTVANCRILNSIGYVGGAVCNENNSSPTLVNCVFKDNVSPYGGGISNVQSDPNVINCTFTNNVASGSPDSAGGGIYNDKSSPTITNCIFTGNFAYDDGGGICNDFNCNTSITNCTFSGNTAGAMDFGGGGSGIFNNGGSNTMVSNCILWGNVPDEIYVGTGTVTINHSDVQGGWEGEGNIDDDPLFVDADGPDDVVGTDDDDLRLSSGSPCIDAGDSTSVSNDAGDVDGDGVTTEQTPWDIDGNLRFLDDPSTTDTGTTEEPIPIVDMGAYESSGLAMIGDFEPDGDVDLDDLVVIVARWLELGCGQCGGADLSGDGSVNLADFAKFAQTGLVGGGQRHKPIFAPIGNRYILEQQNLSFAVSATDPDGDDLTYSAFNLPDGAGFEPLAQVFDWTPTVGQAGKYFVTFYVSDGIEVNSETVTITVIPEPVGCWTMDDNSASTTVLDSSSNENHGTARQNTEDISTTGVIDDALTFNGTSDYVDCGNDSSLQITGNLSISAWVRTSSGLRQFIVSKDDVVNRSYSLFIVDGMIRFQIFEADAPYRVDSTTSINDGTWHHIVGINDGTDLKIYVDGELENINSGAGGAMDNDSSDLWIGARNDLTYYFNGSIDGVRIFDSVLSATEVEDLYNEGGI